MDQIRVGLSVNEKRDKDLLVTQKVIDSIRKYAMVPLLTKPIAAMLDLSGGVEEAELYELSDFVVS